MPIHFEVKVGRLANLYFFVQNLSEWEPWFRRPANDFWRERLAIPAALDEVLKRFAEVHRRHSGDPGTYFLGKPFYGGGDAFVELSAAVGEGDASVVREAFAALEPYFDRLWLEDEPALEAWRGRIDAALNDAAIQAKICPVLAALYGTDPEGADVVVELTVSAPGYCNGRANFLAGRNSVRLEVSRQPLEKIDSTVSVAWHELIHALYDEAVLKPVARSDRRASGLMVHELAAGSIFPRGFLGQELFGLNDPKFGWLPQLAGHEQEIVELTRSYYEKKLVLNEKYINDVLELIEKVTAGQSQ